MNAGTLTSVEEYLATSYDPDLEYADGTLSAMSEKLAEYEAAGAQHIWLVLRAGGIQLAPADGFAGIA